MPKIDLRKAGIREYTEPEVREVVVIRESFEVLMFIKPFDVWVKSADPVRDVTELPTTVTVTEFETWGDFKAAFSFNLEKDQ